MSKGYIVPDVNTFPPPPEPTPAPTPRTDWAEARVWNRYKQAEDIAPEDNARAAIREACEHASTLERELTSAQAALAAAEKAIRKGSEDALYMRDDLLKQLAAAKEDTERLENLIRAVENTLSNIPAYHEGDFIVMHYDGEGRELGPEYIDPFCVVGHIDQSLRAAIDDARSKESDTAG